MTWLLSDTSPSLDAANPNASLDGASSGTQSVNTFTWIPSYGSDEDSEQSIREARFGDGYSQRSGIGINNLNDKWNLVFNIRSSTEKDDIKDFLRARIGGMSFYWTPFDEIIPIRVFCRKWKIVADNYNSFSITCTFERVYGE